MCEALNELLAVAHKAEERHAPLCKFGGGAHPAIALKFKLLVAHVPWRPYVPDR